MICSLSGQYNLLYKSNSYYPGLFERENDSHFNKYSFNYPVSISGGSSAMISSMLSMKMQVKNFR